MDLDAKMAADTLRKMANFKQMLAFPHDTGRIINACADLIESLAAELEKVKRERDAAVDDITESAPCFACKNFRRNGGECKGAKSCLWAMIECEEFDEEYTGMSWEWRGVKED